MNRSANKNKKKLPANGNTGNNSGNGNNTNNNNNNNSNNIQGVKVKNGANINKKQSDIKNKTKMSNKNKTIQSQQQQQQQQHQQPKVNASLTKQMTSVKQPASVMSTKQNKTILHNQKEQLEQEPIKKIERSRSFILSRGLQKIRNAFGGSKENVNKIDSFDDDPVHTFTRSVSLMNITLRKNYRRSLKQSTLEQLSEESVPDKQETAAAADTRDSFVSYLNNNSDKCTINQSSDNSNEKKISTGLISKLKRTFSIKMDNKNEQAEQQTLNTNWSASLQSLQQIDNMVSYTDLRFIDYDKFNTYNAQVERTLSQRDLSGKASRPNRFSMDDKMLEYRNSGQWTDPIDTHGSQQCLNNAGPTNVVLRRKPRHNNSIADVTDAANFDLDKNLYRQSFDKDKLKMMTNATRKSFRLSNIERDPTDVFALDQYYLDEDEKLPIDPFENNTNFNSSPEDDTSQLNSNYTIEASDNSIPFKRQDLNKKDCAQIWGEVQSLKDIPTNSIEVDNNNTLKSRSLTHLDSLESNATIQNAALDSTNERKPDYLEVQSNTSNKICCLPSPPTVAPSSSSIKKKSSSFLHRDTRKPVLARSQVSSSEYFSVYFDVESDCKEKEEFIPATKGSTLADALYSALCRRGLSFSQILVTELRNSPQNVFDTGTMYMGFVDENTDVGLLAGKSLTVTEKDDKRTGHHTLQKAASVGYKTKPAKLFFSTSTEECLEQQTELKSIGGSKVPKQRWSVLFGIKNPQQNHLCELLNNYAKSGVPQPSESSHSFSGPEFEEALNYLEKIHSTWTDFVNCSGMTDTETKIQSAIWELVTTEVDYIHALQTVTDLFLACLDGIKEQHILKDIDQSRLFSNIRELCDANLKFWSLYLYPMVKHSIITGHTMCVDYFQPGFVTFATIFQPYTKYCAEQSMCQFYCKDLNNTNPLFTSYLAWCESQKKCNRLRLADILVRPMQRLTKYSLLLSAIRKHISDENDAEIMDAMIHSVEDFVCSVNSHLTTRQEQERLKGIMVRIEAYDVVDSNNEHLDKMVKQHSCMLDLCGSMKGCAIAQGRHLFMEGDLKFKDNNSKVDVHCFLLTDMLLVCKISAKKGHGNLKVVRQPFMTDKLVIKVKENILFCVYLNDYNMAVTAFTLQCPEAKSWGDAIIKARHIYTRLKQGSQWDNDNNKYSNNNNNNNISENLNVRKSPFDSSIGSRVSSLNNSHSGSVELNESRNVSVDYEKTNSLSSDEGSSYGVTTKTKVQQNSIRKQKTNLAAPSPNTLIVQQPFSLGQSMPNLNLNAQASNNTLSVPGASYNSGHASSSGHSNLLSPSQRGISYPPPSPTRATLRRGFAISSSNKNPPLVKTRNVTSQNSFIWPQQGVNNTTTGVSQQQQQQQQQLFLQQQYQQTQSQTMPEQSSPNNNCNESEV